MKDYQKEFLKLAIESGAFKLGDFTLKSGRQSPYFFNASALIEHGELNKLAELFVKKIEDEGINFDMIYGCLLYTSPSPRDLSTSRMPSSA